MLKEEFLVPMGITQQALADAIKVPFQRVNEVVSGKRGISPSTALRLGKFFGMSPGFWLNLQTVYDLQQTEKQESAVLKTIRRIRVQDV
jgi:addiction module HigA family antidote